MVDRLYHGTYSRYVKQIAREGLFPRSRSGSPGVYEADLLSHPNMVYLTSHVAPKYAAWGASEANRKFCGHWNPVLVEVDATKLNPAAFYPDEDFIKHHWHEWPDAGDDLTLERLLQYMNDKQSRWRESLEHFSTVAYAEPVPVGAILSIVEFNASDPLAEEISGMAHHIDLGAPLDRERGLCEELTKAMMGRPFCPEKLYPDVQPPSIENPKLTDLEKDFLIFNYLQGRAETDKEPAKWPSKAVHVFAVQSHL